MQPTKTATHPNGTQIRFYEDTHTYETDHINTFVSATTLIHHYFPEFDAPKIAKKIAHKHNLTPQELQAQWTTKATAACRYGTRTHENCEHQLLTGQPKHYPENEKEQIIFPIAWDTVNQLLTHYQFLETEKIIFSENLQISGTIDLLMYNPTTDTLLILDWKTNQQIKTENKYQTGHYPITHMQDTNLNHYTLQLSLYEKILKNEKYIHPQTKVERALIHLTPNGPHWIPTPSLEAEINAMLLHLVSTRWNLPF